MPNLLYGFTPESPVSSGGTQVFRWDFPAEPCSRSVAYGIPAYGSPGGRPPQWLMIGADLWHLASRFGSVEACRSGPLADNWEPCVNLQHTGRGYLAMYSIPTSTVFFKDRFVAVSTLIDRDVPRAPAKVLSRAVANYPALGFTSYDGINIIGGYLPMYQYPERDINYFGANPDVYAPRGEWTDFLSGYSNPVVGGFGGNTVVAISKCRAPDSHYWWSTSVLPYLTDGVIASNDGSNWTLGQMPALRAWSGLTFFKGKFIAVGFRVYFMYQYVDDNGNERPWSINIKTPDGYFAGKKKWVMDEVCTCTSTDGLHWGDMQTLEGIHMDGVPSGEAGAADWPFLISNEDHAILVIPTATVANRGYKINNHQESWIPINPFMTGAVNAFQWDSNEVEQECRAITSRFSEDIRGTYQTDDGLLWLYGEDIPPPPFPSNTYAITHMDGAQAAAADRSPTFRSIYLTSYTLKNGLSGLLRGWWGDF